MSEYLNEPIILSKNGHILLFVSLSSVQTLFYCVLIAFVIYKSWLKNIIDYLYA